MTFIPSIDLHPQAKGGPDSDSAVLNCRLFIEKQRRSGLREMRIITGVGIRGDGTPRLRKRIESDVLRAYAAQLEDVTYEQGGAVLRLRFQALAPTISGIQKKNVTRESDRKLLITREARFQIAEERLDLARGFFIEGDLKRCRLKLNQIVKEIFPEQDLYSKERELLKKGLEQVEMQLNEKAYK